MTRKEELKRLRGAIKNYEKSVKDCMNDPGCDLHYQEEEIMCLRALKLQYFLTLIGIRKDY